MSYVSQQFLIYDNSSSVNFRSWGSAISAAFTSMGWVQTSDTGQVNWTTVTAPASGVFVYEIWKPTDALQTGATQFFLKVLYGTSSGSPAGPRLQMQLGTGTNGSGTLTGFTSQLMEGTNGNGNGAGSVITYDCYFSGDINRMGIMLWRSLNGNGSPSTYVIERTHNTDGTDSSDGVNLIVMSNAGNVRGQTVLVFGIGEANYAGSGIYRFLNNGQNSTSAFNNNIAVGPLFPEYGKFGNPLTGLCIVKGQDVAEGCQFTTTLYGATRTYIATGLWSVATPNIGAKYCMRFD